MTPNRTVVILTRGITFSSNYLMGAEGVYKLWLDLRRAFQELA